MRFLASILSLYILVLTAVPCLEVPEFSGSGNVLTQNTTNDTQELPDVDLCSPFCVCSCCVSSISSQEVFHIDFTYDSFSSVQYSKYTSVFSSFNFASIWQPPKLV
jgi:hypothetical protein